MNKNEFLEIYKKNVKEIRSRAPGMVQRIMSFFPENTKFSCTVELLCKNDVTPSSFELTVNQNVADILKTMNVNQFVEEHLLHEYRIFVLENAEPIDHEKDDLLNKRLSTLADFRLFLISVVESYLEYMNDCYISGCSNEHIELTDISGETLFNFEDFPDFFFDLLDTRVDKQVASTMINTLISQSMDSLESTEKEQITSDELISKEKEN